MNTIAIHRHDCHIYRDMGNIIANPIANPQRFDKIIYSNLLYL